MAPSGGPRHYHHWALGGGGGMAVAAIPEKIAISCSKFRYKCGKIAVKLRSLETLQNGPSMVAVNSWWSLDACSMHRTCRLNQGNAKQSGASFNPTVFHITLSFATLHWPFALASITVPRNGQHFGNTKTETRPATPMTCRTDENTYAAQCT